MARKKISEFKAKSILYKHLNRDYSGVSIDTSKDLDEQISSLNPKKKYVLKVDQGIKQRKKKGLIVFDLKKENAIEKIKELSDKGYTHFIIEELLEYDESSEKYFALERVREGKKIYYSPTGGINIEENKELVKSFIVENYEQVRVVADSLGLNIEVFNGILSAFDDLYFSFLEINPLVVHDENFYFIDAAVEVDSAAEFFVVGEWSKSDFRELRTRKKTSEEVAIDSLREKSQASFSYEILNPNGSILLLLSGGGASLVTADEIYQKGKGGELINYGEYSGNPNKEEVYVYAKNALTTLLHSNSDKRTIIIAGGVANFTDVRVTFRGIIKALSEVSDKLREGNIKVFVRRGGPNQEEGLGMMREFLEKENLLGSINGPEMILTDIVEPAINQIQK